MGVDVPKPRLLDLYAGEGGAGMGYSRAGFDVYAVDNNPKRLEFNPFPSRLGDVIEIMTALIAGGVVNFKYRDSRFEDLALADFAVVHGSPTCTGYSRGTAAIPDRFARYDRLIPITRALMRDARVPYVIENVADAHRELDHPIMLCGRMFGLGAIDTDGTPLVLDRHRLFESNVFLTALEHAPHDKSVQVAGSYGGARRDKVEARTVRHGGYVPSADVQRALLGTPWMSEKGCQLSIPPAYSQHIGAQLIDHLREKSAA